MSDQVYPSTKGLSVYNMISLRRKDLSVAEIVADLREHFDPEITEQYVTDGVAFLTARSLATEVDGVVTPKRPRQPDGKCWPLKRTNADADLTWV